MYDVCGANGLTSPWATSKGTLGFPSNAKRKRLTADLMARAVEQFGRTKEKARLFECFQYQCKERPRAGTVVAPFDYAQGPSATPAGPTCGSSSPTRRA